MIVDTSAVIAILFREPTAEPLKRILEASRNTKISAATLVELQSVIEHRAPDNTLKVNRILAEYQIKTIDFTAEQALVTREAYRIYGKASNHKANLNMGDCFSYALAITSGEPLLFVGDDFKHTDVPAALVPRSATR